MQLVLFLELHNRPTSWDLYEELVPLALRMVDLSETDQGEIVLTVDRLIAEAPDDVARTSLLSALGTALPWLAIESSLRLILDPPQSMRQGEIWRRVLWVLDYLLDFVELPTSDPRQAKLAALVPIVDRFSPDSVLEQNVAEGSALTADTAASALRKLAKLRGHSTPTVPEIKTGGLEVDALLKIMQGDEPVASEVAVARLTELLELPGKIDYSGQRAAAAMLERLLDRPDVGEGRSAIIGALRRIDLRLSLEPFLAVLTEQAATTWPDEELEQLLTAIDQQLQDLVALGAKEEAGDYWAATEMALEIDNPADTLRALAAAGSPGIRTQARSLLERVRLIAPGTP